MVEVKRKDNESFEALVRRFTRTVQRSGRILEVKKKRFHKRDISKLKTRLSAIHREEIRKKKDYLKRIGKYDDLMDTATRRKLLKS